MRSDLMISGMPQPSTSREKFRCVLKRLRKGAYDCGPYLVLYSRWINEKWDGSPESYRPWRVYLRASPLTPRAFLDSFKTRAEAHRFVTSELVGN